MGIHTPVLVHVVSWIVPTVLMPLDSRYPHKYKGKFEVKVLYLVWWCADKQTLKHKRTPSLTPDAILDSRKTRPQGLLHVFSFSKTKRGCCCKQL